MQNPLGWVVSSKQIVQEMNLRVNKRRLDEEVTNMVSLRLCNPFGGSRPVNIADFPRVSRKAPGLAKLSFPLARASEQPACQSVTAETRKSRALPWRACISFLLSLSLRGRCLSPLGRAEISPPGRAGRGGPWPRVRDPGPSRVLPSLARARREGRNPGAAPRLFHPLRTRILQLVFFAAAIFRSFQAAAATATAV